MSVIGGVNAGVVGMLIVDEVMVVDSVGQIVVSCEVVVPSVVVTVGQIVVS